MNLNRDELERSIVSYDKQKLITQVLKIFDVNVKLAEELEQCRRVGKEAKADAIAAIKEQRRLERRTLWQVINERLEYRIKKIRTKRDKTFI